ncbi:EEA1, partial [Symbiodinium sp. CCMP2456]
ALLKIGDSAGILFTAAQGSGRCELWRGGHPAPVADATIFFDSLESFRKILQDPNAFPSLLLRRKLRLQGDASFLQSLQRPGSSSETAMVKELAKELDQAIGRALEHDAPEPIQCAAVWVPNDASEVCMECGKEFGILRRRHHCRACGRLLCSNCAPKVPLSPDAVDMTCLPLGQSRNGIRLCGACDANGALPLLSGASTAAPSRRASMASARRPSYMPRPHTYSDISEAASTFGAATEAAAERLREVKEEIEALRAAESKRTERHIRAGVQRIWLATHLCLAGAAFVLFLWRVSVAAAWLAILVALWHFDERSMLARIVRVFWAAGVVTCGVLETRWKLRALGVTEGEEYDAEWNSTHEVLARFLFLQILKLKGFWIKLGQQLSVNVMLAAPYRTEFSKLQDKIPPMPVSDVLKTLQEEFGAEVVSQIDIDNSPPLGTASIAQVHKAIWRPKGAAHQEV